MSERIVLAYSGSARTSTAIGGLADDGRAEVTALILDLGQRPDLEELRVRALSLGATRAHVLDAREEFARECLLPALWAAGDPPARGGMLAYPLIARKLVEVAAIEQAASVAFGGGEAAQAAIRGLAQALDPRLVVRPLPAPPPPVSSAPASPEAGVTIDCSLWGRTVSRLEAGDSGPLPERLFALTRPLAFTPDIPAHVELEFVDGVPISVNGVPMPLVELIESVATIAGNHGVGRIALDRADGIHEAPAALVLAAAHDALAGGAGRPASGMVRMKLFKGARTIVGHSPVAVVPEPMLVNQNS